MSASAQASVDMPRVLALGDAALTVEFGAAIAPEIHARVIGFARALEAAVACGELTGVVEWVPAYRSLTVHFDPAAELDAPSRQTEILLDIARRAPALTATGRRWCLPVCFDAEFAPDLDALAAARGLARDAVVALMTGTTFRVYMLGFLPGFPYLGGLPPELELPRRATPRKTVPERSLAVAGRMCAVYPWESPGGWHLLGRTPVRLFDVDAAEPALLAPGDELRWVAVDRTRYEALERRAASGGLDRESFLAGGEGRA